MPVKLFVCLSLRTPDIWDIGGPFLLSFGLGFESAASMSSTVNDGTSISCCLSERKHDKSEREKLEIYHWSAPCVQEKIVSI